MSSDSFEYDDVTVGFDSEILDAIDEKAFVEHRGNRDAAIRDLLDEWIKNHE